MAITHISEAELALLYKRGTDAVWEYLNALQTEHGEFKKRLGLHSQNSSKPPSTDLKKKKKNNSRNKDTGRSSGGQKGHKGYTRNHEASPDVIIPCIPNNCECGHLFDSSAEIIKTESRQVIDIPQPQIEVLEYQAHTCLCPNCGEVHKGQFPKDIKSHLQYGKNLQAYVVYLMNYQLLPYKRTTDLLKDLHNISISEGTLKNIQERFADQAEISVEAIKQKIITSDVVHFDESGLYVNGQRHWLHVASNENYTFYFQHKTRGYEALEAAGILQEFKGVACHDLWKTYYRYTNCDHSLCNAHHLRDLQGIIDSNDSTWAKEMKEFLKSSKRIIDEAKLENKLQIPSKKLLELMTEYQKIIDNGLSQLPPPPNRKPGQRGQVAKGVERNLLERFDARQEEVIDYIRDFSRPFDNNQAERDIRMVKTKQKISGTFRSGEMATDFCITRSYISTVIKQAKNVFNSIVDVFDHKILQLR